MHFEELHDGAVYIPEVLREAFVKNLKYALASVARLLSNRDADRVVISADHGQAFEKVRVWSHPPSKPIEILQTVPWCVVSPTDEQSYTPEHHWSLAKTHTSAV
jgi:hypothetical protein